MRDALLREIENKGKLHTRIFRALANSELFKRQCRTLSFAIANLRKLRFCCLYQNLNAFMAFVSNIRIN